MYLKLQGKPGAPHEYDDCEVFSNEYEIPVDGQSPVHITANGSIGSAAVKQENHTEAFYEVPADAAAVDSMDTGSGVDMAQEYITPVKTKRKTAVVVLNQSADYEIPYDAA